jgi:predicted nuclease of predicted toxin-antitoxin system
VRLLIDESVKGHIARALAKTYALEFVTRNYEGLEDEGVVALAGASGSILVTEDRGMAGTALRLGIRLAGLIVFELEGLSRDEQAERAVAAFAEMGDTARHSISIVRRSSIRQRGFDPV